MYSCVAQRSDENEWLANPFCANPTSPRKYSNMKTSCPTSLQSAEVTLTAFSYVEDGEAIPTSPFRGSGIFRESVISTVISKSNSSIPYTILLLNQIRLLVQRSYVLNVKQFQVGTRNFHSQLTIKYTNSKELFIKILSNRKKYSRILSIHWTTKGNPKHLKGIISRKRHQGSTPVSEYCTIPD